MNINISSIINVCCYCIFSRPVYYVLCFYTLCECSLHFCHFALCSFLCLGAVFAQPLHTGENPPHMVATVNVATLLHKHTTDCTFFLLACASVCLCAYFLRFLFVFKLKIQNFKLSIIISVAITLVLCIMLAQEIAPTEIGKHANIIRGKIKNEKKKPK